MNISYYLGIISKTTNKVKNLNIHWLDASYSSSTWIMKFCIEMVKRILNET